MRQLCLELANTFPDVVKPIIDIMWFSSQAIRLVGLRNTLLLYTYMVSGAGHTVRTLCRRRHVNSGKPQLSFSLSHTASHHSLGNPQLGGLGLLRTIAPDFENIVKQRSKVEGMFRYIQQRLRVYGESVAFFGGNKREVRSFCGPVEAAPPSCRRSL
jgi:hypothetical protein